MRLLTKKETEHALSEEQRHRIDDGLKVAKKVEVMRETYSDLQSKYENYRTNVVKQMLSEIEAKRKESDDLTENIAERKRELQSLFEPLDKQFAIYVRTERAKIENEQNRLVGVNAYLEDEEKHLNKERESIETTKLSLKKERIENERARKSIETVLADVRESEMSSRAKIHSLEQEAERLRKSAESLKKEATRILSEALLKENSVNEKEKALDARELKLVLEELKNYTPDKPLISFDRLSKRKK